MNLLCKFGYHKWKRRGRGFGGIVEVEICSRCEDYFRYDGKYLAENGYKKQWGNTWRKELNKMLNT